MVGCRASAALIVGLLAAACSSSSNTAAPLPSPTASPTPAPIAAVGKPGCTALNPATLALFARSKAASLASLGVTEGWVVPGPASQPPSYVYAVKATAPGRPAGQVAIFVGFAEQPGEKDDALVLTVNAVAKAVTTLVSVDSSSSLPHGTTDPSYAKAAACF